MESGLGKIAHWIGQDNAIAMNRIAAEDMLDRKDIQGAVNLYHSQATIIGEGAMQIYANDYMKPIQLTNPITGETTTTYTNQINPTQQFVAVGPAVLKEDWKDGVGGLGLNVTKNPNNSNSLNYDYRHDDQDSVRYFAAPSNAVNQVASLVGFKNFNSPIYIPNLITDPLVGLWNLPNIGKHSVTNTLYFEPINKAQGTIQNPSTAPPKSLNN